MTYRTLKICTVLLPPLIIGGFEYVRHDYLLVYLSMEKGNLYITILTLALSYLFATWMFNTIQRMNERLAQEQARRAVYEERERLARELHDNIAQVLFFLNVKLKQGQLEEAKAAVGEIDKNLRQAIFNLRSLPEDVMTFGQRIAKWLEEWSALTGVDVHQDVQILEKYFTPAEEVQLFGIIQEAFTNIRKHADAHHARIRLHTAPKHWELVITDDGKGLLDSERETQKYGISMMQERSEQLGASFQICRKDNGGTEVILTARERRRE